MNPEFLRILDRAVEYSLWVFLGSLVLILIYARQSLKRRKKSLGDLYYEEADQKDPGRALETPPHQNLWPVAIKATALAFTCSLVFFAVFLFTPFPFFQNFAASDAWQITPVRVTAIDYDRFYEGFSLKAEAWNQSEEPLSLTAIVTVLGLDDQPLDELSSELEPNPVEPGKSGTFEVRYEENSPFIKGYQLRFEDASDAAVPHVVGFDAR